MDEYDLKRDFVGRVEGAGLPADVVKALVGDAGLLLAKEDVSA